MANVRYSGGGTSATLGTKEITENGLYNASSDDLDGYSSVTVDVPEPSGSVNLQYTANGTYMDVDVESYETANITVNVPSQTIPTQEKDIIATTSQQVVTPDGGYLLNRVTVDPQRHMNTYTPATDTSNNDMGIIHNYRYVDTSGMITPAGTKEVEYTTNGTHTEDIKNYENIDIEINVPVSGDLGTKTIISNGVYQAIDDNLDGYSEVNVNVPQNATLGIKTITNNGNYYANTDGYDGYSRVDVNVAGATLQTSKSVTATTSQQTVTPDQGYDGMEQVVVNPQVHSATYVPLQNEPYNDMGAQNNYRYVDTSGMVIPHPISPSNSNPVSVAPSYPIEYTASGYAISSYDSVTPSSTPTSVSSGDIVKVGGSGVIVDAIPVPTSLTPSNSNPATITSGTTYTATANGKAVSSVTDITPSNSSPVSLSSGTIYKPSASGKAISSLSEVAPSNAMPPDMYTGGIYKITTRNGLLISTASYVSPSDTNPPQLLVNDTYYRINGASGYLYSSSGLKDVPTYFSGISATTNNSSGTNSVSVTSGKKYLLVAIRVSTGSASDCSITSGATVNKTYVNNTTFSGGKGKLYVVMCTATSSTITVAGTNNILSVLPLN